MAVRAACDVLAIAKLSVVETLIGEGDDVGMAAGE